MEHINAILNFLKRIAFGKVETGQSWETFMMSNMKPWPKPGDEPGTDIEVQTSFWEDDVFSPMDLIKDFDVRQFLTTKIHHAAAECTDQKNSEAYAWAIEELGKIADDDLMKHFVYNYFSTDTEFFRFVIDHVKDKGTSRPEWWWFYVENNSFDRDVKHRTFGSIMEPE